MTGVTTRVKLLTVMSGLLASASANRLIESKRVENGVRPGVSDVGKAAASTAPGPTRPNIIFVLADDLGWGDVGFSGLSNISTPHIDRFAYEGVRMSHYYGQPVCSPSRAAIMTGRYPIAYGLQTYVIDPPGQDYGVNLNETLLPQLLKQFGSYTTAAIGKWHMGMASFNQTPTYRGFDTYHGYYSGGQDYYTHIEAGGLGSGFDLHIDNGPNCGPGCSVVDWANQGRYSTELYSSAAIDVITAHNTSRDGPLFMYLAYQAVHSPDQVPQRYIDPYNNTIPNAKRRTFAGMLSCLDEGIGNVTAAILNHPDPAFANNTLVIFVADNGGPIQCSNSICGDATGTTNYPLRGGKHSLWEGGVRLTAAAWGSPGSGLIQRASASAAASADDSPASGGVVNRTGLMHHTDMGPTLLDAAGILPLVPSSSHLPWHGSSQWGMISTGSNGNGGSSNRSEVLCNIDPVQPAVGVPGPRQGNAALIMELADPSSQVVTRFKLHVGQTGPPWDYMPQVDADLDTGDSDTRTSAVPDAITQHPDAAPVALSGPVIPPLPLWPLPNMTVQLYNLDADATESNDIAADPTYSPIIATMMARLTYWATQVQVQPYFWAGEVIGPDPRSNPSLPAKNGTWSPWIPLA